MYSLADPGCPKIKYSFRKIPIVAENHEISTKILEYYDVYSEIWSILRILGDFHGWKRILESGDFPFFPIFACSHPSVPSKDLS